MRQCLSKVSPGDEIHCQESGRSYRVERASPSDDFWVLILVTELTPGILSSRIEPMWVPFGYRKKKKIVKAKKKVENG